MSKLKEGNIYYSDSDNQRYFNVIIHTDSLFSHYLLITTHENKRICQFKILSTKAYLDWMESKNVMQIKMMDDNGLYSPNSNIYGCSNLFDLLENGDVL